MSTIKTIAATVDGSSITGKISFAVGETVNIDLTCNDPNSTSTPLNLSGLVVIMTIPCVNALGVAIPISRQATITNAALGQCTIPIADGDTYVSSTSVCFPRAYQADIWAEDVSGNRIDLGFGTVVISPAVGLPGATITPLPSQSPLAQGPAGPTGATGAAGADGQPRVVQSPPGTPLTVRPAISVDGTILVATDNAGANRTDLTLGNTAVTPGSYTYMGGTVDAHGRLTTASSGAAPALASTTITAGTGLSGGGDLSTNRTLAIANTAVTPGSYTNTSLTVGADGRITAASNGASGGGTQGGTTSTTHIPYASSTNTLADSATTYNSSTSTTTFGGAVNGQNILPAIDNTYNLGDGEFSPPVARWKVIQGMTIAVTNIAGTSGTGPNYLNGILFFNGNDLTLWSESIGTVATPGNLVLKGDSSTSGGNWTGMGGAGSSTTGGNWTGGGGSGNTNGGDATLAAGSGTTGNGGALTLSGGTGSGTFGGHVTISGGAGPGANNVNDGFARITGSSVLIGDTATPLIKIGNAGVELQLNADKSKVLGHLLFTGTGVPTLTLGSGAGTGATATITGNDTAGHIDVTTAGTPAATATIFTATFAAAYGAAPRAVIITPASSTAAWLSGTSKPWMDTSLVSASAFTWTSGSTPLATGVTYRWWYHVLGSTN